MTAPQNRNTAARLKARREGTFAAGLAQQTLAPESQWQTDEDGRNVQRTVNRAESPVAWLARRKGVDGLPFLLPRHVAALEKLRDDHVLGYANPGLTSNWQAYGAGGSGRRFGSGIMGGDGPHMFRLNARRRCEAALTCLGSLRGLFERVCLDGTSLALAERGFALPRRTGKLAVREALDRLARHYDIG